MCTAQQCSTQSMSRGPVWATWGPGLGCSCITSTLWRSSRENFPGFSLIQFKRQMQSEAQPHLEWDSITADSRDYSLAKTEFKVLISPFYHYRNLIMRIIQIWLGQTSAFPLTSYHDLQSWYEVSGKLHGWTSGMSAAISCWHTCLCALR